MATRRSLFWELLSGSVLGSARASAETEDLAESLAPTKGDFHNPTPVGRAILHERLMTEDEKQIVSRTYTFHRFALRWLCALVVGSLLFGLGLSLFVKIVVPSRNADSPVNAIAWVSMGAGGCTLIACVLLPPILIYKVWAARADVRRGRVRQTTGVLVKYARPPERYWLVGDRRFDIAAENVWCRYADGETITIDCLPGNGDILKIHSQHGSFDALNHEGYY